MLCSAKLAQDTDNARQQLQAALDNGSALTKFSDMVTALGGPSDFVENMEDYLPQAPIIKPLIASSTGVISAVHTREIGLAVVQLGGGRSRADQKIDHAVGLDRILKIGEPVKQGDTLLRVHVQNEQQFLDVQEKLAQAFEISDSAPTSLKPVYETVR
jgi:thymidine phosphorylase